MLVQAAVHGIGAAVGRPMLIARELENRTLVPVFDHQAEAPERCCLITTTASRQRPEVQAFREWVLDEARAAARQRSAPSVTDALGVGQPAGVVDAFFELDVHVQPQPARPGPRRGARGSTAPPR